MQERIIIDGEYLDLYPNESINLNIQINNISDITTRNSSYTNSLNIPRTAKNQRLLGYVGVMGNTTNVPYRLLRCRYLRDTITVLYNGYLQVLESTPQSYRITIYDGIIDLDVALGEKQVKELDFSEYNHFFTSTDAVTDTFSNTEGYIYAIGEFGKNLNTGVIDCEKLAPSIFAHTIWDKIWQDLGFTYTGDFFDNNTDWKELLLPPTKGIDISETPLTSTSIGQADGGSLVVNEYYSSYNGNLSYFEYDMTSETFPAPSGSITSGDIRIFDEGLYEFEITTTHTTYSGYGNLELFLNGNAIRSYQITNNASPVVRTLLLELPANSLLSFRISAGSTFWYSSGSPPSGYFNRDFIIHDITVQVERKTGGTLIEVDDYIDSQLTQKDFIKDILQKYGLIMLRNRFAPTTYEFVQIESLLNDTENAIDWTDKFIEIKKESYNSGYATSNVADYKYPSDTVPYLTGYLTSSNENADIEQTLFTSVFEAPTTNVKTINGQTLYDFPIWETGSDGLELLSTNTKITRLVFNETDESFRIFGSNNTVHTGSIAYHGMDDMGYQYFLDTYYGSFGKLIDSYKEVEIDINFSYDSDYLELDFTRLVYLRQTGKYYYIDSVRLGDTQTAKLIEIQNLT